VETKTCTKCGIKKPLTEFGKNKHTKDSRTVWCLKCKREYAKKRRLTPTGIYQAIKGQIKYTQAHAGERDYRGYIRPKRKNMTCTQLEFVEWYKSQPKKCAYCDIPDEYIDKLNDTVMKRSKRLTIDCKDNDKGYDLDNLVLSCHRCNFMKSDILSYDAMRDVGQRHIKPIWEKILGFSL